VYSSAKLARPQLDADFPGLRGLADARAEAGDDKATLLLAASHAPQMAPLLELRAIVVPKRTSPPRAHLRRASPIEILTALAPSSLFLVPGAGRPAFHTLGRIARRLPGYVLELGAEAAHNLAALEEVLA
jgi:hypothetical protein